MVLFKNIKELQFGTSKLWQNPRQAWENKGEDCSFIMERRGGVERAVKKSIGVNWEFEV